MTRYQRIDPLGEMIDLGMDENNRPKVGFNIMATKDASGTFEEELAKILTTAGLSGVYASSAVALPRTGTCIVVTVTGGSPPLRIHNQVAPAYQRATAQVVARASTYQAARAAARAAYDALAAVVNQQITP